MKLENQVCSESQADRLKELGVTQEALFYHTHSEKWGVMPRKSIDFSGNPSAAFTVAELGEMLPYDQFLSGHHLHDNWCASYYNSGENKENRPPWKTELGDTEAEARAALLIYLLENNLITAAEVNARLEQNDKI